jgi:hypothetical protein
MLLDESVNIAANKAATIVLSRGGFYENSFLGIETFNNLPIYITASSNIIYPKQLVSEFKTAFLKFLYLDRIILDQIQFDPEADKLPISPVNFGGSFANNYRFTTKSTSIIDGYKISSISVVDDTLSAHFDVAKGNVKSTIISASLTYSPSFYYEFQNFSLNDFNTLLNDASKYLMPEIKKLGCDTDKVKGLFEVHNTGIKKIEGYSRYIVSIAKYPRTDVPEDSLATIPYEYQLERKEHTNASGDKFYTCRIALNIEDNSRLISGSVNLPLEGTMFAVKHPTYRFAAEYAYEEKK